MRLKDIVKADKEGVTRGGWKLGKMAKSVFPLSKNKSFRVRGKYRWSYIDFRCLGHDFRVLILYRADFNEYQALLGLRLSESTKVLARYEYHANHKDGWHIHAYCEEIESFPTSSEGRTGYPDQRRISGGNAREGNKVFKMNDRRATDIAIRKFGLHRMSGGLWSKQWA